MPTAYLTPATSGHCTSWTLAR